MEGIRVAQCAQSALASQRTSMFEAWRSSLIIRNFIRATTRLGHSQALALAEVKHRVGRASMTSMARSTLGTSCAVGAGLMPGYGPNAAK